MLTQQNRLAELLLEIKAVSLSPQAPYRWASGRWSPIYCDNRRILGYPDVRNEFVTALTAAFQQHFPEAEWVAGTATAGIPHAAWLADRLALPMAYVRSSAKGHGKQNKIEGAIPDGVSSVVVEDLISTGGSVLNAVDALESAGVSVPGVLAIFSYRLPEADTAFRVRRLPVFPLTDFPTLVGMAHATGRLSPDDLNLLEDWRKDPLAWSDRHELSL